ncbi:MAG TPA: amino acid adenylation domain-containing protein, partial [Thermoanaerobaculia bacterium]|nr:amino acid adenylation domain-containing protein [Thermoanaerobaculia bacterium]
RDLSRTPLFQVSLALQNMPLPEGGPEGLEMTPRELPAGTAKYDLSLGLREQGGVFCAVLEYASDLFDRTTAHRLCEQWTRLLAAAVAAPATPLTELPLASEAQLQQVLWEWSGAGRRLPEDIDGTLHGLFAARVAGSPDSPALVFEDHVVTYGELQARAERLASRLRSLGVGPEVVVGLLAGRSIEAVVGILGVLQAGGAWLPLDPSYPTERMALLLRETAAPVLLAEAGAALPEVEGQVVALDAPNSLTPSPITSPLPGEGEGTPDNLAYVLYTSGSTGAPKGVAVPHRGVVNRLLRSRETYRIGPGDVMLQRAAGVFDVSVWELFGALASGARVGLPSQGLERDPRSLARLVAEQGVTLADFNPSALEAFLDQEDFAGAAASLRQVFAGGEAVPAELPARLAGAGFRTPLANMYGPTEASIDLLWRSCAPGEQLPAGTVPIGRSIPGTWAYVLDAQLSPLPVGIPGELWLGGVGLARGYLGRPDLTAERFLPDPFSPVPGGRLYRTGDLARFLTDGEVQFLGRVDEQVKIRGYRVEPGEIEAELARLPGVREAAVAVREDVPGERRLVGYVVSSSTPDELRAALAVLGQRLPAWMVPPVFVTLESLPRTPGGKVDRRVLPAPGALSAGVPAESFVAPRSDLERTIAAVWQEVLQLPRVGVQDNFFELGGSSLLLARLQSRLEKALGRELPLMELFRHPTVEALARHLAGGEAGQARREGRGEQARARTQTRQEAMRQLSQNRTRRRGPAGNGRGEG